MYSPKPSHIVGILEKELELVPKSLLQSFIRSLGATSSLPSLGIYDLLYNSIYVEYENRTRLNPDPKIEDINLAILNQATKLNQQLGHRLKNVLTSFEFIQMARGIIEKSKATNIAIVAKEQMMHRMMQKRNEIFNQSGKAKSQFNFEAIKTPNQKYQNMNMNKLAENRNSEQCNNLVNKPQCLCNNERQINIKDQLSFQCRHCHRLFHTLCMKRKSTSEFCCYCHMEKMMPLKRVVKTVYIGLFRRNTKKHQTNFFVPEIEPHQKFQLRSLRLKEGAPTACLFPDMSDISMNGHHVKQFEPINKQSCLKYRKDEPFNLIKGDYYPNQENTLVLNETVLSIKEKEVRYQSENHLFGIFMIEDLKIDTLISEMLDDSILGFSESATSLNDCFAKFGKGDEELTCELVKIPLSCPLSTVRIQIPVRGIFCDHFQCFDLKNYLTLISESVNPRWNCPICKTVAYELEIDSIILQILKNIKDNNKIQQILFFRNGDYTAIIDDEPDMDKKNIRQLNIPEKKQLVPPEIIEQKPIRKVFFIPQNADIIDLD